MAIDMISICAMTVYFFRLVTEYAPGSHRYLLVGGSSLYAAIQPIQLTSNQLPYVHTPAVESGFALGLIAKSLILVGLINVFALIAARSREEAARVVEARRTVSRIAHELGTPISQMGVELVNLHAGQLRHQSLANLENAVHRVVAIMDVAHDLEGIDRAIQNSAPLVQKRATVSVNTLMQTAIMAVKQTRDERVSFSIHYAGECYIECVPHEIVQVLINLLRNAFDALPKGEGQVLVRTANLDPGLIQVVVQDSGTGLSSDVTANLFRDGFSTRGGSGRGHGLSVCKVLTERNAGSLSLTNVSDGAGRVRGCRAELQFPRVSRRKRGAA